MILKYIALRYAQSTRCPTVFILPSLCPVPSPNAVPRYLSFQRPALFPVHTLFHGIYSFFALPCAQSKRCATVLILPSPCAIPSPHAVPLYSLLHRSALCLDHTLSHIIHSFIALHFAQTTRCPKVFTLRSLCPMSSPHAVPQFSLIHRSALCPVHTLSHSFHSSIALPYAQSTRCPTVFNPP
jgi:hypothetical protein